MRRRVRRLFLSSGSIILEASIATPIFLLFLAAMISSITAVNADLYIQRATENVVSELNVAIPLASQGILCVDDISSFLGFSGPSDSENHTLEEVMGDFGVASGVTGIDLEDVISTAIFGRFVRDRILIEYGKLSKDGWVYEKILQNCSVYLDYEGKENSIYLYVYYDLAAGPVGIPRSYCSSLALYAEKFPDGSREKKEDPEADSVWEKDNFERGEILREKFGGDLPYNFPTISSFDGNEAISIKSIDTTSPYYQSEKGLKDKIRSYIRDLSGFDGAKYGGYSIGSGEVKKRTLIIIIPKNGSEECRKYIEELRDYAKKRGVEIKIKEYGNSHRYITEEESSE